jgi:hypothetical protein
MTNFRVKNLRASDGLTSRARQVGRGGERYEA